MTTTDETRELAAHMADANRMMDLGQPVSYTTVRGLLSALRSQRPEWEVKAEALEEVADHLSKPKILWRGDSGVTVYDSIEQYEAGRPQPARITDWLLTRAAGLRKQANQ